MAQLKVQNLFNVAGKHVLVTGGGRGIGEMIAKGFVMNGATVYISSRDKDTLSAAADSLNQLGGEGKCVPITSNLGSRAGCEELASQVKHHTDRLHVLVNNSGASWGEPFERASGRANWGFDKVLELNIKAPFYLTQALHPLLTEAASTTDPARVINIGSVVGVTPQDLPTHAYDASKAAVHSLTRKLAYDLGKGDKPVTVNAIAPGYVHTRMTKGLSAYGATPDVISTGVPLGRLGNESDMAGAALFLSSPAAAWVSGAILPVDGGMLTQPLSIGVPQASL